MRPTMTALTLTAVAFASIVSSSASAAQSPAAKAITAPSGADRAVRARQCEAQASKRSLSHNTRQAYYKSCLASAAPVAAVGSKAHQATPTPAKRKLEALTDTPSR
ncbi:hypothetical protein [Phenylobacterium sp.]|uniref:hypothetical protein n=1 Tax=Phenylobacterium sp. TaxID=1871053 RepID=UPI0025F85346|nr:hypothetical protein [Phenylobacterium sp.]